MKIEISYTGKYPNLCSGKLTVTINGKEYEFPDHCLSSGGCCCWDSQNKEEILSEGRWTVHEWPSDFPEEYENETLTAINDKIPHGCCGGCL
jgi:hypothetical protein